MIVISKSVSLRDQTTSFPSCLKISATTRYLIFGLGKRPVSDVGDTLGEWADRRSHSLSPQLFKMLFDPYDPSRLISQPRRTKIAEVHGSHLLSMSHLHD